MNLDLQESNLAGANDIKNRRPAGKHAVGGADVLAFLTFEGI